MWRPFPNFLRLLRVSSVMCWFDELSSFADETVTLSAVLERLSPHLAQIKVLHKVFCTGVAEVPPETPNVLRASHLLNTLYKAIIEYDSVGEASEQTVGLVRSVKLIEFNTLDRVHGSSGNYKLWLIMSSFLARWHYYFRYGRRQLDRI